MGEVFQPIEREEKGVTLIESEEESGAKWERERERKDIFLF